jgi:hypothetical protein
MLAQIVNTLDKGDNKDDNNNNNNNNMSVNVKSREPNGLKHSTSS